MSGKAPVAIVTGASRGAGRGIALALGSHGCTVYVTGRSEKIGDHALPGTIYETAQAVTAAGGTGIAVRCDHADDAQVKALFDQVQAEQGRIDILVNNAAAVYDELSMPGNFWEKPLKLGDMIDVGLRSSYVASWLAASVMVAQNHGLIVFTSASGAAHYSMGPAYGAHKAGLDKLAFDMAVDFRDAGVDVVALSIWMGALATDRLLAMIEADPGKYGYLRDQIETPEYTGHVVWGLYNDPHLQELNGETVIGAEAGAKYGILDEGDRRPPSYRDTHKVAPQGYHPLVIR
ncbi:NAD(P)-dependent dehydrogenase (short-subunit alcohol dehydrogenase family) [Novosphingobium chloroacetimidivorans]|uniref:NAD(P)-dependent dehydrogenase (Short-subunit alcohol dehydrogenase family) n=1 Tax=Novosphingobium chloroacetimidivorans TaxID=1428314 RepID=A0A7W7KBZ7_9SPHN|nr:SDR family NAD(P)-dependent oxidoreductase [Novosphingobium chloroacetimidivorans]MBB4859393.1 NAD(P)-dependent dehydrogenase (short-subunit alcohol dehydrogenase family) [Novosphingobium chloroacetimidivorans]